jgi:hypothetical protein
MKRILLALVLLLPCCPAHAAGVFNGSTSDCTVEQPEWAPVYPILISAWFRPSNTTTELPIFSITDDSSGGEFDAITVAARGDVGGNPIRATATAAGESSSVDSPSGFIENSWQAAFALFTSPSSRQVRLGSGAWSTPETTTRSVNELTHWSAGSHHDGGPTLSFDGSLADVAVWSGFNPAHADLAADQIIANGYNSNTILSASIFFESGLRFALQNVEGELVDNSGRFGCLAFHDPGDIVKFDAVDVTFTTGRQPRSSRSFRTLRDTQARFAWPVGETPGPLPPNRVVTLDAGYLALAADDDEDAIGFTIVDPSAFLLFRQAVATRPTFSNVELEVAAGVTITPSEIVYQAADGMISDSGTIRVGVALGGGTAGEIVEVVPE